MGLTVGKVIKTQCGKVTIKKELGFGAQGAVYLVDYNGAEKAFKWYHKSYLRKLKSVRDFYKNIVKLIENGSPSKMFLWPIDITLLERGKSFGYVMDLRSDDYFSLSSLLLKEGFKKGRVDLRVESMLNMVNGFRILHNSGYIYKDINDGNFFINPNTGEVLACDVDNVTDGSFDSGILGKMRYMAPEIVRGEKMPDKMTDRFSLAVTLFMLAFKAHPLEGRASSPVCMSVKNQKTVYGNRPIFVFDPQDDSNRPIHGVHHIAIKWWPLWPEYIRDLFMEAFSSESMKYDAENKRYYATRPIELEWMRALIRARNCLVKCSHCGEYEFVTEESWDKCSYCGRKRPIVNGAKLDKFKIPLHAEANIYRMSVEDCENEDALEVIAKVIEDPNNKGNPNCFGLKNVSQEDWMCQTTKGQQRTLKSGETMPIKKGIVVNTKKGQFSIT